jgi:hypothetical protein
MKLLTAAARGFVLYWVLLQCASCSCVTVSESFQMAVFNYIYVVEAGTCKLPPLQVPSCAWPWPGVVCPEFTFTGMHMLHGEQVLQSSHSLANPELVHMCHSQP